MTPLVSIVVPVYNAEKSVGMCIASILRQSFRDFELILIHDGGRDGSLQICRNYAQIDNRVRVFDIPNGGVSNARNCGISHARGKYIQFVDSDDEIAPDMTQGLLDAMELYEKDLVMCSYMVLDLCTPEPYTYRVGLPENETRVYDLDTLMHQLPSLVLHTSMFESPWNKLYKRELIDLYHISFDTGLSLGEDFLFVLDYLKHCNGVVMLSEPYYIYHQSACDTLTTNPRPETLDIMIRLEKSMLLQIRTHGCPEKDEMDVLYMHFISRIWHGLKHCCGNTEAIGQKKNNQAVARMANDSLVRKAFQMESHYIASYPELRKHVLSCNVPGILEFTRRELTCAGSGRQQAGVVKDPYDQQTWGTAKRFCVKCLNGMQKVLRRNAGACQKISTARCLVIEKGVKNTVKWALGGKKSYL